MDEKSKSHNVHNWPELVRECNDSGMPKTEWCRQHGITPKSFFYHQRRLRRDTAAGQEKKAESAEPLRPAELPLGARSPGALERFVPDAVIRTGNIEVGISGGISAELLSVILKGIRHAQ